MSRSRLFVVYGLLAFLLLGHLYDCIFVKEHWPFSNYPMFQKIADPTVTTYQLVALVGDAHGTPVERPFDVNWVPSLPPYKVEGQIRHYAEGEPNLPRVKMMLEEYLSVYDSRRQAGLVNGPSLQGLRLYKIFVPLLTVTPGFNRMENAQLVMEAHDQQPGPPMRNP